MPRVALPYDSNGQGYVQSYSVLCRGDPPLCEELHLFIKGTATDSVSMEQVTPRREQGPPDSPIPRRRPVVAWIGRLSWGLADQLLSSATNFALGLLVARSVPPSEFGAFAIAYAVYILALGGSRALAGEPLVVRFSESDPDEWHAGVRSAAAIALVTGSIVGLGCFVAGFFFPSPLGTSLVVLGPLLPILLVQDVWRFAFFAEGKGSRAFLNDLVWALVLFAGLAVALSLQRSSVGWLVALWGGSGALAGVFGVLQTGIVPGGLRHARSWLRTHRDLVPRFFAEFALSGASANLTLIGIGAVTELTQVARLRAGQVALGPLNVLFSGAGVVTVAEGVRRLRESPDALVRSSRRISIVLGIVALAWGAMILMLPDRVGSWLLGENWFGAHSVILPLSLGSAAVGLAFGPVTGLRSLAAAKRSLRARFIDASLTSALMLAGAIVHGALGAAWGLAIAGAIRSPMWWWQFTRGVAEALAGHADRMSGARP
jgi:O-antigen/teichoic acid export membrane protein